MLLSTLLAALFLVLACSGFLAGLNGDFKTSFVLLVGSVAHSFLSY